MPHYTYDIFVSYAHVDDLPEPVTQEGGVTTLVQGLKRRLAQKLGRNDAFTLWMDRELAGNIPITPEIIHTLQHSATLLLILSPGYLASNMCRIDMRGCWLDDPDLEARLVRMPKVERHFHFESTFRARARPERGTRGPGAVRIEDYACQNVRYAEVIVTQIFHARLGLS